LEKIVGILGFFGCFLGKFFLRFSQKIGKTLIFVDFFSTTSMVCYIFCIIRGGKTGVCCIFYQLFLKNVSFFVTFILKICFIFAADFNSKARRRFNTKARRQDGTTWVDIELKERRGGKARQVNTDAIRVVGDS
jgi:hypothetical protein